MPDPKKKLQTSVERMKFVQEQIKKAAKQIEAEREQERGKQYTSQ
jgi:hypothetical protein